MSSLAVWRIFKRLLSLQKITVVILVVDKFEVYEVL